MFCQTTQNAPQSEPMQFPYFAEEPEHYGFLRDTLRRFAAQQTPPEKVRIWDRERRCPQELFAKLAALGVCGLTVDEAYGGQGRDIVAAVMVLEELARSGTTLAGPYIHCAFYAGLNISEKGDERQKAELLPKVAAGEIMFAYGLSEPDIGADLASVATRAELIDGGARVRVNGAKRWCTMADVADYIYCLVRSDDAAPRYQNLAFLLIPRETPGVIIETIAHQGMGYAETCDVTFDDVEISADNIIGGRAGWNQGWPMLAGPALDVEKIEIAALAQGLATATVDLAWRYAQERTQFGKPIARHQAVAHALADAQAKLLACRQTLYYAAWLADQNKPCSAETSMAKLFVTETAVDIALECQKVMGAYGFADEYDMERHVRDLLLLTTIGGSTNIQKNNIAKRLGL